AGAGHRRRVAVLLARQRRGVLAGEGVLRDVGRGDGGDLVGDGDDPVGGGNRAHHGGERLRLTYPASRAYASRTAARHCSTGGTADPPAGSRWASGPTRSGGPRCPGVGSESAGRWDSPADRVRSNEPWTAADPSDSPGTRDAPAGAVQHRGRRRPPDAGGCTG